ncbi:unnamed protein product [Medioppia subpectinata]|uniref:m7GpppX diphosphatase n=1 Tax=Medioppia subpectinata TaxID=1979941 RepID=A0A7R9KWE6_9ACAR|nr:unnamed protein product [Medioppia subpectinata]CAG2109740.1 unnamed protein product [Medioppia subpectinata]
MSESGDQKSDHKKRKLDESVGHEKKTMSDITLDQFEFTRVLNERSGSKWIAIEAKHVDQKAVIILEKMAFNESNVKQILKDTDQSSDLRLDFQNDIYGNYLAFPRSELNGIKTTIIYPATDRHIHKHLRQEFAVVLETSLLYEEVTQPHIESQSQQLSLQWVHNILDHKSETERIVCDVEDPEIGFVLLPDMKWDGIAVESLYLVAISRKAGIRSLRDLNETHLPLLNNIQTKGCEAIEKKYGVTRDQLRIYIHYQPSYYHFHIHFTALANEETGFVERIHLLDTVINNITVCKDYYQKSSLLFPIKTNDPLFKKFADKQVTN